MESDLSDIEEMYLSPRSSELIADQIGEIVSVDDPHPDERTGEDVECMTAERGQLCVLVVSGFLVDLITDDGALRLASLEIGSDEDGLPREGG